MLPEPSALRLLAPFPTFLGGWSFRHVPWSVVSATTPFPASGLQHRLRAFPTSLAPAKAGLALLHPRPSSGYTISGAILVGCLGLPIYDYFGSIAYPLEHRYPVALWPVPGPGCRCDHNPRPISPLVHNCLSSTGGLTHPSMRELPPRCYSSYPPT